mmetsp:Transcript_45985/g.103253  ORF Transcript_45985/g.103253 Transcript_45985/m.103253 type:complete len:233 (-) Transcript_45985:12-710(-)
MPSSNWLATYLEAYSAPPSPGKGLLSVEMSCPSMSKRLPPAAKSITMRHWSSRQNASCKFTMKGWCSSRMTRISRRSAASCLSSARKAEVLITLTAYGCCVLKRLHMYTVPWPPASIFSPSSKISSARPNCFSASLKSFGTRTALLHLAFVLETPALGEGFRPFLKLNLYRTAAVKRMTVLMMCRPKSQRASHVRKRFETSPGSKALITCCSLRTQCMPATVLLWGVGSHCH